MSLVPLFRACKLISCIAFSVFILANSHADVTSSAVFLDSAKSIEERLSAMKSINHTELIATPEQMIAILGDDKLPDEIRCFVASELHLGPANITADNQKQIDKIATSIFKNNQDGGAKLKLRILSWIESRNRFMSRKGKPTVSPTAMKNLLANENAEIRQKAILLIREDDNTFAEELINALKGKPLGKATTLEALEGLARHYPHAPFNKEALIPLLKNESLEISTVAAQQLARSDERHFYHEKLRPLLTDAETPTAMKIATMDALTRSLLPNNQELHNFTKSLHKIVHDQNTSPELRQNALISLYDLIKNHPPESINREITEPLYNLHLSFLKPDPDGTLFEVIDHDRLPKWAGYSQSIYIHLINNYPELKEKREARRLIAEQNKIKKSFENKIR